MSVGASPPSASSRETSTYEFSDPERDSLGALAGSMSFVGVCLMLLGMLGAVFALGAVYAGFLSGGAALAGGALLCVAVAWWVVSAGRALSALVGTRGRDIDHLMKAVGQLRRLFGFARIAVILLALGGMAVASVVFWCTFNAEKTGRCALPWG